MFLLLVNVHSNLKSFSCIIMCLYGYVFRLGSLCTACRVILVGVFEWCPVCVI